MGVAQKNSIRPTRPEPSTCSCGGRPQLQMWGSTGKWWVCCDSRECAKETGTFTLRDDAVKCWNRIQVWVH